MENTISSDEKLTQQKFINQDINKFAGEGSISLIGKFGGRFLTLIGQILVARLLDPALFGIFSIGMTLFKLVQIFAPLGLNNAVIWFGSKFALTSQPKLRGVIIQNISVSGIAGLVSAALILLSAPFVTTIYGFPELQQVLYWIAFSLIFANILRVGLAATRVSQIVKYSVFIEEIFQPVSFLVLLAGFYFLLPRLVGALAANLLSFLLATVLCLYFVYRLFFHSQEKNVEFSVSTRALLVYGLPTAFTGLLGSANNWVDRLLIGLFAPASEVGIYQAASQTSMMFFIILAGLSAIFAPMIADLHHKNEYVRVRELYVVSTKWALYLGTPAFIALLFVAPEIMQIFGSEYRSGALPLIILSIGQMINLSTGLVGYMLVMTGNQNIWLKISIISLVLNIILNIFFTSWFGVIGTAVATSISVAVLYEGGLLYVRRNLSIWPYDRRYIKGIIASIVTTGACLLLSIYPISSGFLSIIVFSGLAYFAFFIAILIQGLDQEDFEVVTLIRERIAILRKYSSEKNG